MIRGKFGVCGRATIAYIANKLKHGEAIFHMTKAYFTLAEGQFFTREAHFTEKALSKSLRAFSWCGKQDLNLHEIAFTRT